MITIALNNKKIEVFEITATYETAVQYRLSFGTQIITMYHAKGDMKIIEKEVETELSLLLAEFKANNVTYKIVSENVSLNDGSVIVSRWVMAEKNGVRLQFAVNQDGSICVSADKISASGRRSMIRSGSIMKHLK